MLRKCYYCHEKKDGQFTRLRNSTDEIVCRECNTNRKRKYRESAHGKAAINRASRKAYINHREKWIARSKAQYAVKTGELIKPNKCEVCEIPAKKALRGILEGHHEDYSKPLEVIWLCSGCHADADRALEAKAASSPPQVGYEN